MKRLSAVHLGSAVRQPASLIIPLVLTMAGCFYPADRGRALEARMDRLTAESADSQQRLSKALPQLDEKIAQVTKALDGLDRAARRTDADIGVQLQKTVEDVAQLRGQVETYLFKINEMEASLKKVTDEADQRAAAAQTPAARAAAETRRKSEELTRPSEPKKFLALAQEKASDGDLALARQLYSEFLKKWPKDDEVPQAHVGLGDTFAAEDKCPEALYEFGQVATKYPKSRAAPEALLKSSDCFRKTKDNQSARAALEEILASYPKSEAAKSAKVKLAELDKPKGRGSRKGKR